MQLTKEQEEKILTVIQSPQVLKKIFEALYPIAIEPRKTPSKYNLEFLAVGASTVFNVNTYPSIKTTAWRIRKKHGFKYSLVIRGKELIVTRIC